MMRIDVEAFNVHGPLDTGYGAHPRDTSPSVGYPKSEPALESSYVFPKVDDYGVRSIETPGVVAVPKNC